MRKNLIIILLLSVVMIFSPFAKAELISLQNNTLKNSIISFTRKYDVDIRISSDCKSLNLQFDEMLVDLDESNFKMDRFITVILPYISNVNNNFGNFYFKVYIKNKFVPMFKNIKKFLINSQTSENIIFDISNCFEVVPDQIICV